VVISAATAEPAAAFDKYGEFCGNDTTRSPKFQGSEWNQSWNPPPGGGPQGFTLRDPFYWGYLQWLWEAKKWDGTQALNAGANFDMDFVDGWKLGGAGAVAVCSWSNPLAVVVGGRGIMFNKGRMASWRSKSQGFNQGLSGHEWGHAWGLGHSGVYDSHDGGVPTMATCISESQKAQRINLSQDDVAAAAWLTESSGWAAITANNSFETGTHFWKRYRISLGTLSGGVDGSPRRGRLGAEPASGNAYIRSNTRVTNLGTVGGNGRVRGDRFSARINVKDIGSGHTGHVTLVVRVRAIVYNDITNNGCNFYGDNKNSIKSIGGWVYKSVNCSPRTTWRYCTTSTGTVPTIAGEPNNDNPDAADAEVFVYNRTRYPSGTNSSVDIDRVRARWDF